MQEHENGNVRPLTKKLHHTYQVLGELIEDLEKQNSSLRINASEISELSPVLKSSLNSVIESAEAIYSTTTNKEISNKAEFIIQKTQTVITFISEFVEYGLELEQDINTTLETKKTGYETQLESEKKDENEEKEKTGIEVDEKNEKEKKPSDKPLVLVVEDDPHFRSFIIDILDTEYQVEEAPDGNIGFQQAVKLIPDIIISDIMMPGINGYELCHKIKSDIRTSHIPVIMLTVLDSGESTIRAFEQDADDYIVKPCNPCLLQARIENLLRLRTQMQLKRTNPLKLQPGEIKTSHLVESFYQKLQDTIETQIGDPDFTIDTLCKSLAIDYPTLYRKVLALTGKTPIQLIRWTRLTRAAHLFNLGTTNPIDVARKVGMTDVNYFNRCYKEEFGRLPSSCRLSTAETSDAKTAGVDTGNDQGEPGREMILIVEDDQHIRNFIREALEVEFHIEEAENGKEGVKRTHELLPDIIVSDIMMPDLDGYDLCQKLKHDPRTSHIPIILLTALDSKDSTLRGLQAGADDYLTKPFNINVLYSRIKNILRLRRQLQQIRNLEKTGRPVKITESKTDKEFEKNLEDILLTNYQDPSFQEKQLAELLRISPAIVERKILALTGQSTSDYLLSYRLHQAVQALEKSPISIDELAYEVGFDNVNDFEKAFINAFHYSPSIHKNKQAIVTGEK